MNPATSLCTVGPLAFRLEPETGMVRDIRFHGCEILRAIYPAVRDAFWGTLQPRVGSIHRQTSGDRLALTFSARVADGGIEFDWHAEITAEASGALNYRWRGQARCGFATNRTGLCVLHPAEVAGAPCVVEHTDGTSVAGWLPSTISPHQPFKNLRAITYTVARGAEISTRMEGEVFEMEDQRNWTDASFKTYCRPLEWPRPYRLETGAAVEHTVRISVRGTPASPDVDRRTTIALDANDAAQAPCIGYTLPAPVPHALRERLRSLRPAHLRVEAFMADLDSTLAWARREAEAFACALHVAIVGASHQPPARAACPSSCLVALFDAAGNSAPAEILAAWRDAGFEQVAAGTLHHFIELNRQRPPAHGAHSHTTFGINAQVHAFDDASLMETLTQHPVVARHAAIIGAGRPVCIAPILLGPTATTDDPRLKSDFAAEWVRGCVTQLGAARCVESITLFRTHGAGGILREEAVTPLEELLRHMAARSEAEARL